MKKVILNHHALYELEHIRFDYAFAHMNVEAVCPFYY